MLHLDNSSVITTTTPQALYNIVALMYKLATVNKTRDICPERFPNITLTSSLPRGSTTRTKTKKTTKILPRKMIIGPEKTKLNAIRGLGKRAKKLDGERPRAKLCNWCKLLPTKSMPNGNELKIHTYLLHDSRVEVPGVSEDSVLQESIGLLLSSTPEAEVGRVIDDLLCGLCLSLLFLLFFIIHR
jgi:hypothetical protein